MSYRLLKFDIVHPKAYLEKKKKEWDDLDQLSAAEYRNRLIALRSNYSDFYTHYLNEMGWEAEEFFLRDETYIDKLGKELFGLNWRLEKLKSRFWEKVRPRRFGWTERVIKTYIEQFNPDVLFVRSQPLASEYWQQYRDNCLLVSRLSARLPRKWHPNDWDLIYTDLELFRKFFEVHDVPTKLNKQGFDPRINDDLRERNNQYEVTFVGGMGTENFSRRTQLFEKVAAEINNFKWWGYWWEYGGWGSLEDFPNLKRTFQGPTSGLDMYQIYRDSKIVLNDYVDTSPNNGFNQRMFEVMGVGSFMLTREAENFDEQFPADIFATFSDAVACIDKIKTYLQKPDFRQKVGESARQYVEENYHYRDIVQEFHKDLIHYI